MVVVVVVVGSVKIGTAPHRVVGTVAVADAAPEVAVAGRCSTRGGTGVSAHGSEEVQDDHCASAAGVEAK